MFLFVFFLIYIFLFPQKERWFLRSQNGADSLHLYPMAVVVVFAAKGTTTSAQVSAVIVIWSTTALTVAGK